MTELERETLKRLEMRVERMLDDEGALFEAVAYKLAYARGRRIATIDADILTELRRVK